MYLADNIHRNLAIFLFPFVKVVILNEHFFFNFEILVFLFMELILGKYHYN